MVRGEGEVATLEGDLAHGLDLQLLSLGAGGSGHHGGALDDQVVGDRLDGLRRIVQDQDVG